MTTIRDGIYHNHSVLCKDCVAPAYLVYDPSCDVYACSECGEVSDLSEAKRMVEEFENETAASEEIVNSIKKVEVKDDQNRPGRSIIKIEYAQGGSESLYGLTGTDLETLGCAILTRAGYDITGNDETDLETSDESGAE